MQSARCSHDPALLELLEVPRLHSELFEYLPGVLPPVRRRRPHPRPGARERYALSDEVESSELGVIDRLNHVERLHVRILENLLHVVDGTARDAGLVENLDPFRGTARQQAFTDDLVQLYQESLAWKNCPRWNAEGEVKEDAGVESALQKFLKRAEELGLSSVDVEQIVAENKGDYVAALKAIEEGVLADINSELETSDMAY